METLQCFLKELEDFTLDLGEEKKRQRNEYECDNFLPY